MESKLKEVEVLGWFDFDCHFFFLSGYWYSLGLMSYIFDSKWSGPF